MKLKSVISILQEVEINLETPAFFKNPTTSYIEYIGIIEECTIEILHLNGMVSIKNSATESRVREIKTAYDSWEHISEEEFFEALDKALKDFNFKPSLRHITAKEGSEVTVG